MLGVCHILHNLWSIGCQIIIIEQSRSIKVHLFQPSEFLPMRTISKYGLHITANRLLNQSMSCIEYSVGRFECRDFLCRIIDKTGLNVFKDRQFLRIFLPFQYSTFYLNVPKTIIWKTRMPDFVTFTFQCIFIIMLTPCLTLITSSFIRQCFRYYQGDFLSSFTTYGYLRKTGQILSHIQHNCRRVYCSFGRFGSSHHLFWIQLGYFLNIIPFHNLHRRCHLRTEHSFRRFLNHYRTPMTIIETNLIPSFLFATGIIIFPSINTIKGYRTQIIFPLMIRTDRLACSILIIDYQFK